MKISVKLASNRVIISKKVAIDRPLFCQEVCFVFVLLTKISMKLGSDKIILSRQVDFAYYLFCQEDCFVFGFLTKISMKLGSDKIILSRQVDFAYYLFCQEDCFVFGLLTKMAMTEPSDLALTLLIVASCWKSSWKNGSFQIKTTTTTTMFWFSFTNQWTLSVDVQNMSQVFKSLKLFTFERLHKAIKQRVRSKKKQEQNFL